MKYPKYTREQNLCCKLSDEDIANIRILRGQGWAYAKIGRKFHVIPPSVWYWCLSEEKRKNIHKENYIKFGNSGKTSDRFWRKRKQIITPEFIEYKKERIAEYKKKFPDYNREYYRKHKEMKKQQNENKA